MRKVFWMNGKKLLDFINQVAFSHNCLPFVNKIAIFATEYKITTMISNNALYFWFYYPVFQQEIGE